MGDGRRHWVQDREFGLQFWAEMLNAAAPTTKEGIEKYLSSGMVTRQNEAEKSLVSRRLPQHCWDAGW